VNFIRCGKIIIHFKELKRDVKEEIVVHKLDGKLATTGGWHGVDLDSTLAKYDGWKGDESIGQPVPRMYRRVKMWLKKGERVKIFTARVCNGPYAIECIRDWLEENNLPRDLEITNVKDFECWDLWDDRAVQVVPNEGIPVSDKRKTNGRGIKSRRQKS
jgi:hypothetical protein